MTRNFQRRKRRRILGLLFTALLLGIVVILGASRFQARRQRALLRSAGLAALEQHNYRDAADDLGKYVATNATDSEAMYAYSRAVRGLGFSESGNLTQAIAALRHVCEQQPGNVAAAEDLLDAYTVGGFNSESIELASRLLRTNPQDEAALWHRAVAAVRLRRFKEALIDSRNLNNVAPRNLDGQLLTIDLLHLTEVSSDEILAEAESLRQKSPDQASSDLVGGFARQITGDRAEALALFRKAATDAHGNANLVPRIVRLLDSAGVYNESIATLQDAVRLNPQNLPLRRQLARRLDEANRPDLVLALLEEPDAATTDDADLLISRGIALLHLQKLTELAALNRILVAHPEAAPQAWSKIFDALLQTPPSTLSENLRLLQDQITRDSNDPMLRLMLGNALAASGKVDEALTRLQVASQLSPTWAAPHARRAELLLTGAQPQAALEAARAAAEREPQSVADAVLVAQSWSATLPESAAAPAGLLQLAEQVRHDAPQETRILPTLAMLYLRNQNRTEAQKVCDAAVAIEPAPPLTVLTRLAEISRSAHLDGQERLIARCQERYGLSPEIALAQAMSLSQQNQKSQALALLTPPDKLTKSQRLDWDLARVRFIEQTNDPGALAACKKLLNDYPQDSGVLHLLLNSDTSWQDTKLVADALDRLKTVSGPTDPDYRTGRARLLLADPSDSAGQQEAVALLNDSVQAAPKRVDLRLFLARALRRTNNIAGASEQIAQAAIIQPNSTAVCLAQAQMQADDGDFDLASSTLQRFVSLSNQNVVELRQGALLLARLHQPDRAISCLLRAYPDNATPADPLLMQLYRETKEPDKAQAVADAMLVHPEAASLEAVADFYGSTGHITEAQKLLARLDDFPLDTGLKELARARFASHYEGYELALQHLTRATADAPKSPRAWNALVEHLIAGSRIDEAIAATTQGVQQTKGDPTLRFLLDHVALLRETGNEPQARALLLSMIDEPANRQASIDALNLIRSQLQGQSLSSIATAVQTLAARQPQFLALQVFNVQLLLETGHNDDAVSAAVQCMHRFPDRAEPAALAAEALASAGRWQESAVVARQWRSRPNADQVSADVVIADSELRLGDAASALSTVGPYLTAAQTDATRYMPVIVENARALLASGRVSEAANLLTRQMAQQPRWRTIWIRLAVESIHEPEVASAWLKQIAKNIPQDASGEQIELARAWFVLGQQYKLDDFRDQAQSILESVTKDPKAGAIAFTSLAMLKNARGDQAGAEQAYRKATGCKPPDPIAQNNLATILNQQQRDANEAVSLASAAVNARPQSATFLDTLAQAQWRSKKPMDAIASWNKALALEPANASWHLRLAEAYVVTHDLPHARQVFEKAQLLATNSPTLPADFQDRLAHVRQQIVYAR